MKFEEILDMALSNLKNLEPLKFINPVFFYMAIIAILVIFVSFIINNLKTPSKEILGALKYNSDGKLLKIKIRDQYIEIKNVKPAYLEKTFWRNDFEILNNIFNKKFIDVEIISKRNPRIRLYIDKLPISIPDNSCPPLNPMQTWIGQNQFGNDVIINLQETPSIYLDGRPGSGKTVALVALLKGYIKGINDYTEALIVTTKPADFFFLKNEKNVQVKIIDPFGEDFEVQVQKILKEFSVVKEAENIFKGIIEENAITNPELMNLEALRQTGIAVNIPRQIFIFDEAKDYLSKNKADSKDEQFIKQKLISTVYTHIRRTARFLSMPIIVASQTQNETDLDIPIKMFHLRLASSTNEAMSRIICNDKRLTDLSFTKGKFFLKTDKEEHIIRIPKSVEPP